MAGIARTTAEPLVPDDPVRTADDADDGVVAPGRLRAVLVVAHRVLGLAIAVFLVVAGLTGSVLAFQEELDALLTPGLHTVEPSVAGARPLDPLELRTRAEAQLPAGATITYVPLVIEEGHTLAMSVEAPGGGDDEYFVDPYTGHIIGSRRWGDPTQGVSTLVSFIYRLHYSLGLGDVGVTLLGLVALLWTLDCFVGLYLTFPPGRRGRTRSARGWLARWRLSWLVRSGKLFSFVFSWHRASGLWLWPLLLVFAWSTVSLNLKQVYHPVMSALTTMSEGGREQLRALDQPRLTPELAWVAARDTARLAIQREAHTRGFTVLRERSLSYEAGTGTYRYRVKSTRDISDRFSATSIWIDGDTGAVRAFEAPTGEARGATFTTWIYNLHWAGIEAGGWPYRVFVSVIGVAIAVLSITGVWIWWRKRRPRART